MGNIDGSQQRGDESHEEIEGRATGKVGDGSPPINSSVGAIEVFAGGGRPLGETKSELGARCLAGEAPMPTYGYLRKGGFLDRRRAAI